MKAESAERAERASQPPESRPFDQPTDRPTRMSQLACGAGRKDGANIWGSGSRAALALIERLNAYFQQKEKRKKNIHKIWEGELLRA